MAFPISLGDLFPLRGSRRAGQLALAKPSKKQAAAAVRPSRIGLETLEPRVLLSADSVVSGITASLTTGLTAVGTEIGQLLEDDPLFNVYVPGIVEERTSGDKVYEVSPTLGEAMSISVDVGGDVSGFDLDVTGSTTLADRYNFIDDVLTGNAGNGSDEAALRAIDIDNDGQASWDEAFQVMVVGRMQEYLAATTIVDQDSDADVDAADLGLQVAEFLETSSVGDVFGVPTWLTDRVVLNVQNVASTVKNDALTFDADFSLSLVQRDRFDLGYEADKLGILLDPGTPPNPNNNPFKLPVSSTIDFGSFIFGFTGLSGGVASSDFFFGAPDKASDPTDGVRIGVNVGSASDPFEAFIGVNVGFLGAHVVDPDAGNATDSGVVLNMNLTGLAVDPSNVAALGFTDAQQGTPAASGIIEADGSIDTTTIATTAIQFTLKVGNDPLHPETELTLPAGSYADTAAIVAALNTALGGSSLNGIVSASDADADNHIGFTVAASDPSQLGFSGEQLGTGSITAGAVSGLIGVGKSATSVQFLLSVNNVFKVVTVNVTVDADGADNNAGTADDNNAITIDSLVANLQAGLTAAFGGGVTAGKTGANRLTIAGAGQVEITRTLTIDTLERITLAELQGPAQSFEMEADPNAAFTVNLKLLTDAGLQKQDDTDYRPVGTIKVDIDPFTPNAVKPVTVDTDPLTGAPVIRASYQLTDAAGVSLKGGTSDMQTMLDFNVINVADILGTFNEIGNWFDRVSSSSLLQGFDLPFGDTTLGNLLNLKDLIADNFLIDDKDDGPTKSGAEADVEKLLKWVLASGAAAGQEKLVAMFGNAQQLESRLNTILGMDVDGTVFVDGEGRQNLTYEVNVADYTLDVQPNTAGDQPLVVPLDFELDLGPVANFETSGKLVVSAKGDVGFTFGVILGNAVDALEDSTDLLTLNSDAGVKLNTNLALTTIGNVTPLVGRLTADAVFKVTVFENGNPQDFDVTLAKSQTDGITTLPQLIAALNTSLSAAGLGGKIVAAADPIQGPTASARILLQAASATITRFQVVTATNNPAYTQLGLQTQAASTVSLVGSKPIPAANPNANFNFTLTVVRSGGTTSPVISFTPGDTADNVSLQSLINDLNAKLPSGIVASQSGGLLVLSAVDSDIRSFTVTDADALGLDLGTANDALQAAGVTDLPTALVAGVQWRAGAAPADPFGRLASDVSFTINGESVTVVAASTSTNVSVDDLVRSVNTAIEANADLKGKVAAINENNRITLRSISSSVHSLTVDGFGAGIGTSAALGMQDGSSNGALAVRSVLNAPVSYGVSDESVSFTVTINGTVFNAELTRDNTIGNRSLYDLAASLNNAINLAVGGVNKNPLVATVQSGQIVIGLKTTTSDTAIIGDPSTTTAAGGIKASDVTSFSINSSNAKFASELRLISAANVANTATLADFIVFFRNGTSANVVLDSLDTDGDQKLDKTLGELIDAIEAAAPGRIEVLVNTDGTSLRLHDLTAGGGEFKVVAVNGSTAAAQLGILGSDTSNLNIGEVLPGAPVADGFIEGGKLATIDLKDRFYIADVGASAELTVKTQGVVSAEATFGFAGIKVSSSADQTLFTAEAELPIVDDPTSLRDLFAALGDDADLLALVGDPTLTLAGDFSLAVTTFPDASALLGVPGTAAIKFKTDAVEIGLGDQLPAAGELFPDLGIAIETIDFGDLLKFDQIQFTNVIDALQAIAEFLKQFEALDFLGDDIPVLGLSVNDLIDLADDFQAAVDDFRDNPAGGIQALAQKIQESLGLPNFANTAARDAFFSGIGIDPASLPAGLNQLIQFVIDGDVLRFDLRMPVGFNKGLNVDLDLGEALGADLGPIDIQGGAGLAASGFLDARLSFGIDLSDPTKLLIYDDDTGVFGGLSASAQNLQFNAAIGPLGVFVRDGKVVLDLDFDLAVGDGAAGAEVIDLTDPSSLAAFFGTLNPSLTGSVDATLPVYFPTDSEYLGDIQFDAGFALSGSGLETTSPNLQLPDLSNIDFSSINPFNSIPQMLDALDFFLQGLQDIMDGEVFGVELPLVGDQLKGAADFIEDLRRDVLGPIRQYAEQAPDLGMELVQKLLFSLLGSGSAGVTVTNPLTLQTQSLASFLGLNSEFSGLDILKDYDSSDGETAVTFHDIVASNANNNFEWLFRVGQSYKPSVDIDFDIGIDALALEMDVGLDITIDWDLAIGVGIGPEDGAYIFIGDQRGNDSIGNSELVVSLEVDLADESQLTGTLGFLQLEINESDESDPGLENDGAGNRNTYIGALFSVDLKNSADSNDSRLSFSELGSITADVFVSAEAEVNLDVVARFNPDIVPAAVSALLPEVSARFVLDWESGNVLSGDLDFAESLKLLGFRDVNINMGSFINDFLKPFVDKIAEVTGPLQPIIDVITAPIPVISDLAGQPISLVDIAGMTGYVEPAMIYAIADIISLVNKIGANDYGDFAVPLGDFMLIGGAQTLVSGTQLMDPGYKLSGDSQFDKDNLAAAVAATQGSAIGSIGSLLNGGSGDTGSKDLVSGLASGTEAGSSGFAFPLFDDPALIFGLLLGKDIPLITYDLAPFKMDFSYTQKFPVWDALFVRIGGSAGLSIDLAFGYDTAGVRQFAEGGFSNPLDLLAGFYVSDTDQATGEGTDVPELILKGELFAGAELNLGIASAGAEGVIGLIVNFDLYDPDSDGKVRVDELLGNFLYEFNYGSPALAPIAIFDVTGQVYAQLRAFVEALFFKYTFEITPPITLFEFEIPFEREPFLATERGDGSLLLNIGPNSGQRLNGDTRDLDETIYVKSISDSEVLVWNGTTVKEGDAQHYKVNKDKGIFGYGGSGNDLVDLSQVTHDIVYTLEGGVGDDTLLGTAGGGTMKGDLGNDTLTGGAEADFIQGGEGNDTIDGKGGADYLFGDTGIVSELNDETYDPDLDADEDQDPFGDRFRSFVAAKDGDDKIFGGDGADIIFGGGGNDTIEGQDGDDVIVGDGGNFDRQAGALIRLGPDQGNRYDINARGAGGKDQIFGNAGNDVVFGGASDDFIDGGADNDELDAGAGFDTVYGGSAADVIYGGTEADIIFGGRDPKGDLFGQAGDTADAAADGIDTVYGEDGNDYIRGNEDNDVLRGGRGADIMFGDTGGDTLFGEAGGDIMFGGADGDTLDGSDGSDIAFGDDGLVVYFDFEPAHADFDFTGSRIRFVGGDQLIGDSDKALRDAYASEADALATSMDLIVTKTLASDGSDTIIGGDGGDIVFGGGGLLDKLFGDFDPAAGFSGPRPNGKDLMIGDGGRIELSGRRNERAAAESGDHDGNDQLTGNDGGDYLFGGGFSDLVFGFQQAAGTQPLDGVSDNDVIVGDNGEIKFDTSDALNRVKSVNTTVVAGDSGRSDTIDGDFGNDIVLGGLNGSSDVISGDVGDDVLLGDNGEVRFDLDGDLDTLDRIESYADGLGGTDTIGGNDGNDVLVGGTDADTMQGDNGEDILLGDNARIELTGPTGRLLIQVAAMPAPTAVDLITTTDVLETTGGADVMAGNAGNDILFGGVNNGGVDVMYGDAAAPVNALDGDDILVGDNGLLDFSFDDSDRMTLDLIRSTRDGLGGVDTISGNAGSDIGIGGTAGDTLYGDNAGATGGATDLGDILLGDNADVLTGGEFGGAARLKALGTGVELIRTTDTAEATGGIDTISGNAGADVVLGGVAGDVLHGDAATPANALDGNDVLLGDNGELDFADDRTLALQSAADDLTTLDRITSYRDNLGGVDTISGNAGADTALGGTAGDTIHGDNALASGGATDLADVLLGDNGELILVSPLLDATVNGADRILILGGAVATIKSTDLSATTGGVDTISGNAGGDIALGGVLGDTIYGDRANVAATNALDGNDILLGDNGALEWLSTGRLDEISGIDLAANNAALVAGFAARDANLDTLDLVTTEQPNNGGRDLIFGDNGRDTLLGGTDADTLHGDSGDADASLSTGGNDLMMGDHGRLYPQYSTLSSINSRNFFAIDIGDGAGGEGDRMWGEEGDDIMLGQQGDDRMWGGTGDDDMIGGHNVSGGYDELGAPAIGASLAAGAVNPVADAMNDAMDGGAGDDLMTGDNTIVWRRGDDFSPRFRQLTGPAIYTTTADTIVANIGAANQSDPADAVGRDTQLLDHSDAVQANPLGRFGNDVMAGGSDDDTMFGQLGDDLMQGDGFIGADDASAVSITRRIDFADSGSNPDTDETLYFNIPEQASDGDDYMEGNGGRDLMYGGLGQDDMLGGSSALFGLNHADPIVANQLRPDSSDTMFGGAGIDIARNHIGDATLGTEADGSSNVVKPTATGHARDADYMMGDNANVYRLVDGADNFRVFAYDNYGSLKLVPRAMQQLDYTLGGADYRGGVYNADGAADIDGAGPLDDNGAADLIHGESGDDTIFGMAGSDVLFGEGQDDDIVGGYGHDWISGGTGQDGVIGDDGIVMTSRNGTAEPLFSIAATVQETISTPGQLQLALINKTGDLKKTIDLVPFSYDADWIARDDEFPDNGDAKPFADDIVFGGWGSDFLHGGSGDDAISGAEALNDAYVPVYDANGNPIGLLDLGYDSVGIANALVENPTTQDPGNVLFFHPIDADGQHLNNRFRAGEFDLYNEYDPRRKIRLDATGSATTNDTGVEFLLNFDEGSDLSQEGVKRPGGTVPKATGQQTTTYGPVYDDGADAIFGDLGNDWIVGGTGRDNMYGGWGNDLMQADDNLDTDTAGVPGVSDNESPDTHPTYEDRAYGGAGRDVLIGNTGGDRLIDWVGEYNSYLVPFAPFGAATVSRTLQPFLPEFLYQLSAADGADPTRIADTGSGVGRNGEPAGELGLVLQKDFAWQDQTGAPADPQAGNIPGGPRDVLRSASFDGNQANAFVAASGTWSVANNAYEVAPLSTSSNKDAISLFNSDVSVPSYFEITATINAIKPIAGLKANAYIIFDYHSATDFKFAGIDVSNNKIQIGQRASWGFQVLASQNMLLKSGTDYNMLLAVNGSAVTLVVNNAQSVSFAFTPRRDSDGFTYHLNAGMYGLGADNAKARIDNVVVQQVPPKVTLTKTDTFDGTTAPLLTPYSGTWTQQSGRLVGTPLAGAPFAVSGNDLSVSAASLLKLEAVLSTTATAGLVFDAYSPTDFKWAAISKATNQVLLGHYTAKTGWVVDASVSRTILAGDNTLSVTLKGSTVSVNLNGQAALSRVYNSVVVDGAVGTFTRGGSGSFNSFTLQTDDPRFGQTAGALSAAGNGETTALRTTSIVATGSQTGSTGGTLYASPVQTLAQAAESMPLRTPTFRTTVDADRGTSAGLAARAPADTPQRTAGRTTPWLAASPLQSQAPLAAEAVRPARAGQAEPAPVSTEPVIDWGAVAALDAEPLVMSEGKHAGWQADFVANLGTRRNAASLNSGLRFRL